MKNNNNTFKKTYPNLRYFMKAYRNPYIKIKNFTTGFLKQNTESKTVPNTYDVCNTNTIDSEYKLNILEGKLPKDINGNMYICQCLGTPEAFMVGDTNLVKLSFDEGKINIKNKFMWNPVTIAKSGLQKSVHKFDHMGLMFMSPGMGMASYTEGMYLMPDGRLAITSDVDRPWIVNRETLKIETPLGTRKEWLPMMSKEAGDVMGNLFAGYSNSHVIYTDVETDEVFLVNYQTKQKDGTHPCLLMKWDGENNLKKWQVIDEAKEDILIEQSIHELIFTKDYIILADTAFVTGSEILSPWKNSPLPNKKTITYIINRNDLTDSNKKVTAKRVEIDEACIHLIAEYENPKNQITLYMLHTPATNTAEIIRSFDKDLNNKRFSDNLIGYGTLPVLDLSSLGKHTIDMNNVSVKESKYIRDKKLCWGPYMYTYMNRQLKNYKNEDLFVMFKGFKKDMLPKRIFKAYSDVENRQIPLEDLITNEKISSNNSIAKVNVKDFEITDSYEMPDKVLLYTISSIVSDDKDKKGYILAAIVKDAKENDETSGHEYWLFDSENLKQGPICKFGHKELNNSILFHTVYIPNKTEKKLDKITPTYNIDLKNDYKKSELKQWNDDVPKLFEDVIYPYFNSKNEEEITKVNKILDEYSKNRIHQHAGKEHLISEQTVENPKEFAENMIKEANRLFKTTGWKEEYNKKGLIVESKPIKGIYEASNVRITRASSILKINANILFEYITSPKGYAVIDPVCDPEDHDKEPLEVYKWKKNCRLEAALTSTEIKMLEPSEFVVLNAIDNDELIFASKSILHEKIPGASKYIKTRSKKHKNRAINTFVIKIEKINQLECKVLCINYADMTSNTQASINNFVNCKAFFPPLYKRMNDAVVNINQTKTEDTL